MSAVYPLASDRKSQLPMIFPTCVRNFALLCLLTLGLAACGGGGSDGGGNNGGGNGGSGSGNPPLSIASFSVVPEFLTAGESGRFAFDVQGNVASCSIDVRGDGSNILNINDCANVPNEPFTFNEPGEFEPTLTVTGADGSVVEATFPHTVGGGPIRVDWRVPQRNTPFEDRDDIDVFADIFSDFDVESVVFDFVGTQSPIELDASSCGGNGCPRYRSLVQLVNPPRGRQLARLIVTDVNGNSITLHRTLRIDGGPALTVTSPLEGTVARPQVTVNATCDDDDPNSTPRIVARPNGRINEEVLIDGPNRVVDLSAYEGHPVSLKIVCIDSGGLFSSRDVWIYVDSSPALNEALSVNGPILDVTAAGVAYRSVGAFQDSIGFFDRSTGTVTEVEVPLDLIIYKGFVTPTGAIFETRRSNNFSDNLVFELRDDVITELASENPNLLDVAGDFGIFVDDDSLIRIEFSTDTQETIAQSTQFPYGIFDDGTVVYRSVGDFFFYSQGVTTPLTQTHHHSFALTYRLWQALKTAAINPVSITTIDPVSVTTIDPVSVTTIVDPVSISTIDPVSLRSGLYIATVYVNLTK